MSQMAPKDDENFFIWAIYDSDGGLIGIRDDAPKKAKMAYEAFMKDDDDGDTITDD